MSGVWNAGPGSQAGYRVQEVLLGQSTTAVGRTTELWGSLTVAGTSVVKGTFTANMADVVSDQSERNHSFRTQIMDVAMYPTATFTLTEPIDLGNIPGDGTVRNFSAAGTLDMHGVTKAVSFPVSAERLGDEIAVLADIPILFSDWNIANPSIGGFVNTADKGTLELLLRLTQGAGQPGLRVHGERWKQSQWGSRDGPLDDRPTAPDPVVVSDRRGTGGPFSDRSMRSDRGRRP